MENLPELPEFEVNPSEYDPPEFKKQPSEADFPIRGTSFPQISDEMVASIALGMDDDAVIAARHNITNEQMALLLEQPWFQAQVAVKRAEFDKSGITFRAKAAWMASDLLDQVYVAVSSQESSVAQKHDVLKTLIKAGGLEVKEDKKEASGPTFQISIDLGAQSVSLTNAPTIQPVVIDAQTKEISND